MSRQTLIGTRIRERRLAAGIRQVDLARDVGISPTYLNLIEHNRRKIGGKILADLARVFDVSVTVLSRGAETELLDGLRTAAAAADLPAGEAAEADQLAGRYPGWAGLIVAQQQRIAALERAVEGLSDKLAHDPFLAESLHEVLSTVTAIRSTASILDQTRDIDPSWRKRFQSNIFQDSTRLATTSQALVSYIDGLGRADPGLATPLERIEKFLQSRGFHLAELEPAAGEDAEAEDAPQREEALETLVGRMQGPEESAPLRAMAKDILRRYLRDAQALPLHRLRAALSREGLAPDRLAENCGAGLDLVLRRLATLPPSDGLPPLGLVRCDGAGALTLRRPLEGFTMPAFGAACGLWPLFQALQSPGRPLRQRLRTPGGREFLAYAVAGRTGPAGFGAPQIVEATMLLHDASYASQDSRDDGGAGAVPVGPACRICPVTGCAARREPSIMRDPP